MEVTNVSVSRTVGKYNWANTAEVQAQIIVQFTLDGARYVISDLVEPDSQHDYEGDDVSDAVDHISNSIDRYWISTSRDETKAKIKIFWDNETAIRKAYAAYQAKKYQRLAARNADLARAYLDEAMAPLDEQAFPEAA